KVSKITVTSRAFAEFLDAKMSDLVEQFERENSSQTDN
ncbi:MAG: plasmid partitioning protein RepB, partial [Shinella sp.]